MIKLYCDENVENLKNVLKCLDIGLLLGAPLDENYNLITNCSSLITKQINQINLSNKKPSRTKSEQQLKRKRDEETYNNLIAQEIDKISLPSMEHFYKNYMLPEKPVIILGIIIHPSFNIKFI